MRSLAWVGLLAFLGALLITSLGRPRPLEDHLVHLQVKQVLPQHAAALSAEPAELQALFLAYADDPILVAKARLALMRYPDLARPVLLTYGASQLFQDVLRAYGEDVMLPVHYFQTHEIFTLELMRSMSDTARSALNAVRGLWADSPAPQDAASGALSREERGWYALHFLEAEGYQFLGQFVIAPDGEVGWVQTERILEGINRFFAGGLKGLETKFRRDEAIGAGDVGWAAVDAFIGVSAFKLLRMGRVGTSGAALTFSERSAAVGAGLWRGSAMGARLVKYGAPAVLAYVAIRHPSVINAMLGTVAERLGLPVALVQIIGWTLVLIPFILILRFLLAPVVWILTAALRVLRWGNGRPRQV